MRFTVVLLILLSIFVSCKTTSDVSEVVSSFEDVVDYKQTNPGKKDTGQCENIYFYGVDWSEETKRQKSLLDGELVSRWYINCDKQRKTCKNLKIKHFPTWHVSGVYSEEILSIDMFKDVFGCELSIYDQ